MMLGGAVMVVLRGIVAAGYAGACLTRKDGASEMRLPQVPGRSPADVAAPRCGPVRWHIADAIALLVCAAPAPSRSGPALAGTRSRGENPNARTSVAAAGATRRRLARRASPRPLRSGPGSSGHFRLRGHLRGAGDDRGVRW